MKWLRLKEFANGVQNVDTGKFYPFKNFSSHSSTGSDISGKLGIRLYVKSIVISYETLVTDAGTYIIVSGTQLGEIQFLAYISKTTLTVSSNTQMYNCSFLGDSGTGLTKTSTNISLVSISYVYAEIDDIGDGSGAR